MIIFYDDILKYNMQLIVNPPQRYGKQRSHTATHLLHAELGAILPQAQQQWSLVEVDYLRFDFNSDRFLSNQEIESIEDNINRVIENWYDVSIREMKIDEAEKLWAKMFFQDKYGDKVRVVSISSHSHKSKVISIELCGGTHVSNTMEIGIFKIISQESIASGIKRIIAYTWPKVSGYIQEKDQLLSDINTILWTTNNQILDKIIKIEQNNKALSSKIDKLYQNWFSINQDNKLDISKIALFENTTPKDLLQFIKNSTREILLYDDQGNFVIHSPVGRAKQIWQWLKWWWNDQIFQWKDPIVVNVEI